MSKPTLLNQFKAFYDPDLYPWLIFLDMDEMTTILPQKDQDEFYFEQMTTTMTTPTSNVTRESFTTESYTTEGPEVEGSTYYPIENEDVETITGLPLEPIKPRYFQVIFFGKSLASFKFIND